MSALSFFHFNFNKIFLLSFFAGLIFVNSSCSENKCGDTKEDFIEKFDTLIESVTKGDHNFSDEKWEEYDQKFKTFVEDCYKLHEPSLTFGEKNQFWVQTVEFYYKRYGAGVANQILDENNPAFQELQHYLHELDNDPKEAIRQLLGKIDNGEVKDLLNEISTDVEKWGKKLENLFRDRK